LELIFALLFLAYHTLIDPRFPVFPKNTQMHRYATRYPDIVVISQSREYALNAYASRVISATDERSEISLLKLLANCTLLQVPRPLAKRLRSDDE
jgi:hypothetical protein